MNAGNGINTGISQKKQKNTIIVKISLVKIVQNANISMSKNETGRESPRTKLRRVLRFMKRH